ncbi:MAG: WD40 repeat domain-containing protein [Anaerolineae bacterium]|nr:WD40 repeat domain-containing protein [Anaerolineae bacterium]
MPIRRLSKSSLFILFALLFLLLAFNATPFALAQAPDIIPGQLFTAKMPPEGYISHYFEGMAGVEFQLTIETAFFARAKVFSPLGSTLNLVSQQTEQTGGTLVFSAQMPVNGVYEITINDVSTLVGLDQADDYTIKLEFGGELPPATPASTPIIEYGQTVKGSIGDLNGEHWRFEANAGDIVNISVEPDPDAQKNLIGIFVTLDWLSTPGNVRITSAGNYQKVELTNISLASTGIFEITVTPLTASFEPFAYTLTLTKGTAAAETVIMTPLPADLPAITPENVVELKQIRQIGLNFTTVDPAHFQWSADGSTFAMAAGSDVAVYRNGLISGSSQVFAADPLVSIPRNVMKIAFNPDGTRLAVLRADNRLQVLNLVEGRSEFSISWIGDGEKVRDIAFSRQLIAVSSSDKKLGVWDTQTQQLLYSLQGEDSNFWAEDLAFNADGTKLAVLWTTNNSQLSHISIYNAISGEPSIRMGAAFMGDIEFSPDEASLYMRSENDRLMWMSIAADSEPTSVESASDYRINPPLYIANGGTRLLVRTRGEPLVLSLDAATGELIETIALPDAVDNAYITSFNPALMRVVMDNTNKPGTLDLYDLRSQTLLDSARVVYGSEVVAFSADGRYFAFGNKRDPNIWVVDTQTGATKQIQHLPQKNGFALSADGKLLASADHDRQKLRVWNLDSGKMIQEIQLIRIPFPTVIFSPDGTGVAAYSENDAISDSTDNRVQWFDVATGKPTSPVLAPITNLKQVVSSSQSLKAATALNAYDAFRIRDSGGRSLLSINLPITAGLFSPDDKVLLTIENGILRIWAVAAEINEDATGRG